MWNAYKTITVRLNPIRFSRNGSLNYKSFLLIKNTWQRVLQYKTFYHEIRKYYFIHVNGTIFTLSVGRKTKNSLWRLSRAFPLLVYVYSGKGLKLATKIRERKISRVRGCNLFTKLQDCFKQERNKHTVGEIRTTQFSRTIFGIEKRQWKIQALNFLRVRFWKLWWQNG